MRITKSRVRKYKLDIDIDDLGDLLGKGKTIEEFASLKMNGEDKIRVLMHVLSEADPNAGNLLSAEYLSRSAMHSHNAHMALADRDYRSAARNSLCASADALMLSILAQQLPGDDWHRIYLSSSAAANSFYSAAEKFYPPSISEGTDVVEYKILFADLLQRIMSYDK
jgi:hypothetical protein